MSPLSIIAFIVVILCEFPQRALAQSACCLPKDCQDILWSGQKKSGVYTIYPQGTGGFKVFCDMTTKGGGWTVIQKRKNGKVGFNRFWKEYQYGFGDINGEHWIGNQRIHQLTSQGWYELRIELADFQNRRRYALYRIFSVGSKATGYRLTVGEYEGNAGDAMGYHNGYSFFARDRDTLKCAERFKGGWWYRTGHLANLNGLYLRGHHPSYANGINWYLWHGNHYSLKRTEMKIRRQ